MGIDAVRAVTSEDFTTPLERAIAEPTRIRRSEI